MALQAMTLNSGRFLWDRRRLIVAVFLPFMMVLTAWRVLEVSTGVPLLGQLRNAIRPIGMVPLRALRRKPVPILHLTK